MENTNYWLAISLVNQECQKYKWNKLIYSEICIVSSYEMNFETLYLIRI